MPAQLFRTLGSAVTWGEPGRRERRAPPSRSAANAGSTRRPGGGGVCLGETLTSAGGFLTDKLDFHTPAYGGNHFNSAEIPNSLPETDLQSSEILVCNRGVAGMSLDGRRLGEIPLACFDESSLWGKEKK